MPPTSRIGLPDLSYLKSLRVWDSYLSLSYRPAGKNSLENELARLLPLIDAAGMERVTPLLDCGLGTGAPEDEEAFRRNPHAVFKVFEQWPDRLLGVIKLNPNNVAGSLEAMDRWIRDGPMIGIYLPDRRGALTCTHPNLDPIARRAAQLGALVIQNAWFETGGKAYPTVSTPAELAQLAARHPETTFMCSHAGGEWVQGIRAVRASPNILVETSGFDPTAGFMEMARREVPATRIVFGSHLPGRSLATEYSKILHAEIPEQEKKLILGANLRTVLKPILQRKGIAV